MTLVTVQFDIFRRKLPAFHQFFNFYNALWLSVVLGVTKVLHEFGTRACRANISAASATKWA